MALDESARRQVNAHVEEVDAGLCGHRYFLLWSGIGLDAFVINRIEPRGRMLKHFAIVHYGATAVWQASFWHGMNLYLEADGKQISGHYLLALVNNIRLYAGGIAKLSPNARLNDGKMDLWLFEGDTLGDAVQCAWKIFQGDHSRSERVQHVIFENLRIDADTPVYLQLDGEPVQVDIPVIIQVRARMLNVLVPANSHPVLFGE